MSNRTSPNHAVNGMPLPAAPSTDTRSVSTRKTPMTGDRAKRFMLARDLLVKMMPREGMMRMEALRDVVRRLRQDGPELHDDDVVRLLLEHYRPAGVRAYTQEECDLAVKGFGPRIDGQPQELRGIMAAHVKDERVEWLMPNWIARGYHHTLTGRAGVGKSTFMTGLAKLARRTIWLCGEERPGAIVKARLKAHQIDDMAVEFFTREMGLFFPHCADALAVRATNTRTDLILIDPLSAHIRPELSMSYDEDMLPVMHALEMLAQKSGAAVVFVRHPGKAVGNSVRGASCFMEHPRTVIELVKEHAPARRMMVQLKNNQPGGLQQPREFFARQGPGGIGVFSLGEALKEEEAQFALEVPDRLERKIITDCEEWLRDFLADGPRPRKEIMAKANDEGFSRRTVERAYDKLGLKPIHGNRRAGEGSKWALPDWDASSAFDTPQ